MNNRKTAGLLKMTAIMISLMCLYGCPADTSTPGSSPTPSPIPSPTSSPVPSPTPSLPPGLPYNWLHFGYDNCYTGFNPDETIITTSNIIGLVKKWDIGGGDGYFSVISRAPAIYQGNLYVSGAGSNLTAYKADDGEELWDFGSGNAGWAPQPVVSEDGIIFYLENDASTIYDLYAVNADTGTQIWKSPFGFDIGFNDTSLVTVDEARGVVYLVEDTFATGGGFYALDKTDGTVTWFMNEAQDGLSFKGDYTLINGNMIMAKAESNSTESVYLIDADNQTILDSFSSPLGAYDEVSCFLCYDNTLIIEFCDRDGVAKNQSAVYVYSILGHTELWNKVYTGPVTGKIAFNTANSTVYVPGNCYLYAYNSSTGAEKWKYTSIKNIYSPSVANGIIYFLSDTNMYALNETTGALLYSFSLGYLSYETTQVAINNGMLFFSGNGSPDGDLFALGF